MQLPTLKSKKTLKLYSAAGKEFGLVLRKLSDLIQYSKRQISSKALIEIFEFEILNRFANAFPGCQVGFPCVTAENRQLESFGSSLCISLNDTIAHGKNNKIIKTGDIVSIDTVVRLAEKKTVINLDAAFTMQCGIGDSLNDDWFMRPLMALKSILAANPTTTNLVSEEILKEARRGSQKLSVITGLCGHGIGKEMHEQPLIYNIPMPDENGTSLVNGMCFCPEPIYVKEDGLYSDIILEEDGWSVKTISGNSATHFETTFGILEGNLIDFVGVTEWPTRNKE